MELQISESQRQPNGKDNLVDAQNTNALKSMRQQNQKELLTICNIIQVEGVGYYAENGETFLSGGVGRWEEAVPDKRSTRDYTHFDFTVNLLCNDKLGSGEKILGDGNM
jgi:hypothetical protein